MSKSPKEDAPKTAAVAPKALGPIVLPRDMHAPIRIADVQPSKQTNRIVCRLCNASMRSDGVRQTKHPFVTRVRYACTNPKCLNTTTVEERRR